MMEIGTATIEPAGRGLADRVAALLRRRTGREEGRALTTFARRLLRRPAAHLAGLPDADVAALVESAYRFYAGAGPDLRVRAFSPAYDGEGWDADVSVLETCLSDRPFVVDTITARLDAAGMPLRALLHPILATRRDPSGHAEFTGELEPGAPRVSFVHAAFARQKNPAALERLAADVRSALEDVRVVTDDFPAMVDRAQAVAAELEALGRVRPGVMAADGTAVADFLRWLVDGAFVFLGYREYGVTTIGAATLLRLRPGSGLGLLRREDRSVFIEPRHVDEMPEHVRARALGARLLTVAKTAAESPVHRRGRMDDIGVKALDADGRVIGERRFIGLFTSRAYAAESADVPLLRRTLRQVLAAEQATAGSHDHRQIIAIFNALPKAQLFASAPADVLDDVRTVLATEGSDEAAVTVRPQAESRRVSVLVVLPRERFSDELRQRVADAVGVHLGADLLEDHVASLEGERVLMHFAFAPPADGVVDTEAVRSTVLEQVRSWQERLADVLRAWHGDAGEDLAARWEGAFPPDYRASTPVERAAEDVGVLARLAADGGEHVTVANDAEPGTSVLRFFVARLPLILSECMPTLENLGLRVLAEEQVTVAPRGGETRYFVHAFRVQDRAARRLDVEAVGALLVDAIRSVRTGRADDDVLNRLVVEARLDWRAVEALRAYARYTAQAGLAPRSVASEALAGHPLSARALFACFTARFRPEASPDEPAALRERFLATLDDVPALSEDLALRAVYDSIAATTRTNFFRDERTCLALKLASAALLHVAPPRPLYEIWVHAPAVEGIHLRAGKIARGGIRHSDRPDDLRIEVLGLMQTQTAKNALIVPTGAKGAFVTRRTVGAGEVASAYATFIRGLLDVTDNVVAGRVIHPRGLVVHDEEDPYLVVAADKGTAGFSDLANSIAAEYAFWLGDAFASGGSHGYDHKALGITARGVWESVRTHFRELAIDADSAPLTVVGIGDPSGDVFGNGMRLSRQLRLRAAFNHRHVFLDPDPDPARAFAERERLFRGGRGWDAYDPAALSAGGAIVERTAKRVVVSVEAQAMLGLPSEAVSGDQLVHAVLCLAADVLFNGGIGTYVAASDESDAEVHDPANDGARVRAPSLRAQVVAEGGNLGFTQRARVEYALAGGRIDTDAVDNSAGVDLSDHEVNLKICLQSAVDAGTLTRDGRDALLTELTTAVVERVLAHNRGQSRLLGVDQVRSRTQLARFRELAAGLEQRTGLDRLLEGVPDADALRARRGAFLGLTRPELAVLMAYAKLDLQRDVRLSTLPDDPLLERWLLDYFPPLVVERYRAAVLAHPLRREIVATEVSNAIVDEVGMTFVARIAADTGARPAEVVRAWVTAWTLAGGAQLAAALRDGPHAVEVETTCRLVLERTMERATKWLLANVDGTRPASAVVEELSAPLARVRAHLADWLVGSESEAFHRLLSELEMAGLPPSLARDLATADWLTGALDVATVARAAGADVEVAAARYYALGESIDFAWLWARLADVAADDYWPRRAAEGLVDDLLAIRRRLAQRALADDGGPPARTVGRVQELVRDLRAAPRVPLAGLAVVVREMRRLAEDTTSQGE
jgi:glutamate dehydrogenase